MGKNFLIFSCAMIVSGFADNVSKELPLEYAVEMNNLIRLEMERVFIKDDVSGAAWTTFAPVSRSWPFPAKVMPVNSILAPRPFKMLIGYR